MSVTISIHARKGDTYMPMNHDDNEVSFEIVEKIGVLSTYSTGWTKEINLVRWNQGPARYDIREWDPQHSRMSKGLTFGEKEMRTLIDSMKKRKRYSAPAEDPDLELEDAAFDGVTVDEDGVIQSEAEPENDSEDETSGGASN